MMYGYARVSTDKQENSADAQKDRLAVAGVDPASVFVDEDVTGSIPLKRRPKGQRLWDILKAGDEVVFVKLDRGFRNMADAAHTLQVWAQLGVKVRILDLPLDLTTPEGRLMFHQFAAFSQFEKERIGQRTREVMAHLKKSGKPYSSIRPWGWVRKKGEYAACEVERETARMVVDMRDNQGWSFGRIALALCQAGIKKPSHQKQCNGYYHVPDVRGLYRACLAGYPTIRQGFWLRRGSAQTPPAETDHAHRQSSAKSGRFGSGPRQAT